jgi:DNA-binding LacI/PurR family transcriptional regulator
MLQKKAGVSIATVSYVLNGNKYVSREYQEKVWKAVKELGYQPNILAQSLRKQETKEIGVIFQNIRNLFFIDVMRGIEDVLRQYNYSAVYVDSGYNIEREKKAIARLRSRWVDGIILYSCVTEDNKDTHGEYLQKHAEKSIPIISIDRDFRKYGLPLVTSDQEKAAYLITTHLISCGRTNIVHIGGRKNWEITESRYLGYCKAMAEAGLDNNIYVKYGSNKPVDGYEIARQLLTERPKTDAIFASNDQMAIGCIAAIRDMGMRIPEDIAVAGTDNLFVSTIVSPQLTTINLPKYDLGKKAAQILMDRIDSGGKLQENDDMLFTLPFEIIIRQSTNSETTVKWSLDNW